MKFNYEKASRLLNDVTIDFIEEIGDEIENGYITFEELEKTYEERLQDFCDSYVDVYTSDLLKWLSSCNDAIYFMEQVITDGYYDPKNYSFDEHLRIAQYAAYECQLLEDIGDFEIFIELFNEQAETIGVFNCTNTGSWEIKFISESEVVYSYGDDIEYAAIEDNENNEPGFYFTNDWFIKLDEVMRV